VEPADDREQRYIGCRELEEEISDPGESHGLAVMRTLRDEA
jgi:hypothetical protein